MISLVWGAIWARRAQTATVLALTLLAVGAAASAPWYVAATAEALAKRHIAVAPAVERMVRTSANPAQGQVGTVDPAQTAARVVEALGVAHEPVITGLSNNAVYRVDSTAARPVLMTRDGVCDHATVEGRCPRAPQEVMIPVAASDVLGLEVGDVFPVEPEATKRGTLELTVVGRYRAIDPLDPYWFGVFSSAWTDLEPFFVTPETITGIPAARPTTIVDLKLAPSAYHKGLPTDIKVAMDGLQADGISLRTNAGDLAARIAADQQNLLTGVSVAAGRLVLLCFFTLLIVVRHTASARRPDLGLVKLRGVRRRRLWTMTLGQLVAPMAVGALLGAVAGLALTRMLAGPVTRGIGSTLLQSGLTAGAVFAGAIAVAIASEQRELGAPVGDLLRDVPARVRARLLSLAELVVALLAAVGVWQLLAVASTREGTAAPAVVPALIALTVGLLATRVVLWTAGRLGAWGIRHGHLAIGLAGTAAKRRPALRWVVTLLVIAVAGLGTAIGEMLRAGPVVEARAEQEVGVDRVLTVSAPGRMVLRDAVRAADPSGAKAMAASYVPGSVGFTQGLLAVDTARLADVVAWRPEYGPPPTERAPDPGSVPVGNGALRLTLTEDARLTQVGWEQVEFPQEGVPVASNVFAVARLLTVDGRAVTAYWGPLTPGRRAYDSAIEKCAKGCRLVSLGLIARDKAREVTPTWGTRIHLHSLDQGGATLIPASRFADRLAWRSSPFFSQYGPQLAGETDGLALTTPPACANTSRGHCVLEIFPADVPMPLPVRIAGLPAYYGTDLTTPQLNLVGAPWIPISVDRQASALPRLGSQGAIADLSQLDALVGFAVTGEQLQVWLRADAPDSIVAALKERGVRVLATQTVAQARDRLLGEGPAAVRRFELLSAALGVILAAGALLLAASVERRGRAAELSALRRQGLRLRQVARISVAGYAWPAAAGVVCGLVAAIASGVLPVPPPRIFADRWSVLPVPDQTVSALAIALTATAAGVVAVAAALLAGRRLIQSVRDRGARR